MPSPMSAANPYFDRAYGLYDPYQQQGQAAYNQLNPQLGQMSSDPAAFLENLMKSYTASRGYGMKRDEMLRAAGNSAAAGGMRGSPSDMQNEAQLTDMLMGEDMQQWLQNVLGIQGAGMQGLGHFYDTGAGATSDMANILGTQGSMAFQNQAQKNKNSSDLWRNFARLGTTAAGGIGGFFAGGPVGAMAGAGIGSKLF